MRFALRQARLWRRREHPGHHAGRLRLGAPLRTTHPQCGAVHTEECTRHAPGALLETRKPPCERGFSVAGFLRFRHLPCVRRLWLHADPAFPPPTLPGSPAHESPVHNRFLSGRRDVSGAGARHERGQMMSLAAVPPRVRSVSGEMKRTFRGPLGRVAKHLWCLVGESRMRVA